MYNNSEILSNNLSESKQTDVNVNVHERTGNAFRDVLMHVIRTRQDLSTAHMKDLSDLEKTARQYAYHLKRKKSGRKQKKYIRCHNCGETGHPIADCSISDQGDLLYAIYGRYGIQGLEEYFERHPPSQWVPQADATTRVHGLYSSVISQSNSRPFGGISENFGPKIAAEAAKDRVDAANAYHLKQKEAWDASQDRGGAMSRISQANSLNSINSHQFSNNLENSDSNLAAEPATDRINGLDAMQINCKEERKRSEDPSAPMSRIAQGYSRNSRLKFENFQMNFKQKSLISNVGSNFSGVLPRTIGGKDKTMEIGSIGITGNPSADFEHEYVVYKRAAGTVANGQYAVGVAWAKDWISSIRQIVQGWRDRKFQREKSGWLHLDKMQAQLKAHRKDFPQCLTFSMMNGKSLEQMTQLQWIDTVQSFPPAILWMALGFHYHVHDAIASWLNSDQHHWLCRKFNLAPVQALAAISAIIDAIMHSLKVALITKKRVKTHSVFDAMTYIAVSKQTGIDIRKEKTGKRTLNPLRHLEQRGGDGKLSSQKLRRNERKKQLNVLKKMVAGAVHQSKWISMGNKLINAKWGSYLPVKDHLIGMRDKPIDHASIKLLQSLCDKANWNRRFFFHNHTVYDSCDDKAPIRAMNRRDRAYLQQVVQAKDKFNNAALSKLMQSGKLKPKQKLTAMQKQRVLANKQIERLINVDGVIWEE